MIQSMFLYGRKASSLWSGDILPMAKRHPPYGPGGLLYAVKSMPFYNQTIFFYLAIRQSRMMKTK